MSGTETVWGAYEINIQALYLWKPLYITVYLFIFVTHTMKISKGVV